MRFAITIGLLIIMLSPTTVCQASECDTVETSVLDKMFGNLPVYFIENQGQIDNQNDEARLYYWRTNTGAEVDLLVEKHGDIRVALEIKHKKRVIGADLTGLRSFASYHPDVPCVVVSLVPEEYRVGNMRVMPYARFLHVFRRWL